MTKLQEMIFFELLKKAGLPIPQREFLFARPRKFRFDYCYPDSLIAIEVEGGVWTNGRHTRGSGFMKDMEKYNLAACLGFRLLRFTPEQLTDRETIVMICKLYKGDSCMLTRQEF